MRIDTPRARKSHRVVPASRARSIRLIRSLGKRRSPHHVSPTFLTHCQLSRSAVQQRAYRDRIATLTARRASGADTSALGATGPRETVDQSEQGDHRPRRVSGLLVGRAASPSTHGTKDAIGYQLSAFSKSLLPDGGGSPASARGRTASRTASPATASARACGPRCRRLSSPPHHCAP